MEGNRVLSCLNCIILSLVHKFMPSYVSIYIFFLIHSEPIALRERIIQDGLDPRHQFLVVPNGTWWVNCVSYRWKQGKWTERENSNVIVLGIDEHYAMDLWCNQPFCTNHNQIGGDVIPAMFYIFFISKRAICNFILIIVFLVTSSKRWKKILDG